MKISKGLIVGAIILISGILAKSLITVAVGIMVIGLAYFINNKKSDKTIEKHSNSTLNEFQTRVVGLCYEGRQTILSKWLENKQNQLWKLDDEALSAKVPGKKAYKYKVIDELDAISLIPEPTNPHDKNAIKVVHKEMGHIGYIPAEETQIIKEIIMNPYYVISKIYGGPYKMVASNNVIMIDDDLKVSLDIKRRK